MTLTLDSFNRYTSQELAFLTEINEEVEIKLIKEGDIKYIRATNILKRPDQLAEFLSKFPAEDRNKTIFDGGFTENTSSAPGFQQYIKDFYFSSWNKSIFNIGKDYKLYKYTKCKFDNFTNCCYPGMLAYGKNFLPHTDSFGVAANVYLTDVPNTYTSFFRIKTKSGRYIHNEFDLKYVSREDADDLRERYQIYSNEDTWEDWQEFKGDAFYERYLQIPSEYNSMNMYKGNIWHSITYNSKKSPLRYSLVTAVIPHMGH
jgi:hypothetical protein